MTSRDDRFLLRRQNIEKARAANKITRATLQIRKWIIHKRYVRQQKPRDYNLPVSATNLLITVAFNNSWLIKLQSRALRQFLNDDYHLVVVDNSPDIEQSSEIRNAAGVEGYTYVPAPMNPYSWLDPSLSHSLALDWAWRNIAKHIEPDIVVFLDHDIFPISHTTIRGLLGGALASGYRRVSGARWLLWPGLLALSFRRVERFTPTFMPRRDTDSGGSMWWRVYSRVPESEIRFLEREELIFGDTSKRIGDGSSGEVHLLDDHWLHLVDGSGWGDGIGKIGRLPLEAGQLSLEKLVSFAHSLRTRKKASDASS